MKNHQRRTIVWNVLSLLILVFIVACSAPAVQPEAKLSNPVPANGTVLSFNNFTLSWTYSAGSSRQITEYLVFLGISVEALTTGIPASEPSLVVANLQAGGYFWKVQATTNGQSVFSDIWGFTIAADTIPQIDDLADAVVEPELLVSNVEANSITLEWPKYTDPSNPENPMSYIVELTQASNTATGRQHVETAATGTTFFSLLSGQAYEFEIIAKVLNGNTCVVGHGETETNNHAPSAPTILTPLNNT